MMDDLIQWLDVHRIMFRQLDEEVIEIEDFGKVLLADLSGVSSIFKGETHHLKFNLMESADVLIEEGIYYVAFPFGNNWYYYDLREEFCFNLLKYIGKRRASACGVPYVNLGVHTPYELLNSSGELSLWVKKARHLGHTALGICDYNTMAATLSLQKECKAAGIRHVFGYTFTLVYLDEQVEMKLYCVSQDGLQNLLRLQKTVMVDSDSQNTGLDRLLECAGGNVLVIGKRNGGWLAANRHLVVQFKKCFEGVYFQVDLSEYKADRIDAEVLRSVACYFENFADPVTFSFEVEPILICDCYYPDKDDARSKIILNKIATGAAHRQSDEQYFKDADEHSAVVAPLFSEKWDVRRLFERMCRATVEIAERADAAYETERNFMPRYDMTVEEELKYGDRHTMFLSLLAAGFERLVPGGKEDIYRKRLEHEIYILESTDNVDYMLVQYDTVNWARANGILVGCGRGSAGGCLVLYLLGITLIDPIKYNLLFERFLLPERAGLYPAQTTKLVADLESECFVELAFENGKVLKLERDAQMLIKRGDKELTVYADELKTGDDVVFDHRDLLWVITYFDHERKEISRVE